MVGMSQVFTGTGEDGSDSVRERVGMGVKFAGGQVGMGLKSHPRAHLYSGLSPKLGR